MGKDEKLKKSKDKESEKDKVPGWKTILFRRFIGVLKQRMFWYAFIVSLVVALSPSLVDVLFTFIAIYGILKMEEMRNEARNTK